MADSTDKNKEDELAGTEQPFVAHLMELRDRLLYCVYGLAVAAALLAFWPGPAGLIDLIAMPIRAHMPEGAKLIAVGVFSPFFVPLKVLGMTAVLLALPWLMYQIWMFVAPGLYSHEKKFALPLIFSAACWPTRHRVRAVLRARQDVRLHPELHAAERAGHAGHRVVRGSHPVALHRLRRALPGADRRDAAGALRAGHDREAAQLPRLLHRAAFVVAAVLTPPDVVSQLALAIPMCLLYESASSPRSTSCAFSKAPDGRAPIAGA
jgi:sec-independent protein translocase protein TatC